MTLKQLNSLVLETECALEDCYVAQANNDGSCPDDIYFVAEKALDAGIGAVLVPTSHGRLKWFSFDEMCF
jgi:hypothetical protein